jgi:sterol desaturase/sphingolipid hydroxylase (fatty acid hydroxylase superfamily)
MSWARIEEDAYWVCFIAAFLAIAAWESVQPKRELSSPAGRRWRNHAALLAIATVISVVLIRVSPVALSLTLANSRWGVLNKPWMPWLVRCALAVLLLDLLQYWIHWSFHHVPWLWRVHQVHHSDPDFDVSTAARFHPVEALYSGGIHLAGVALLAPPPEGVLAATLLTLILNFSTHANASLPEWAERMVRGAFITPDLHRIHHSEDMREQQGNLGQTFSWWDRFFGTYLPAASAQEGDFRTGLDGLQSHDRLGIGFMLMEPFAKREEPEVNPDPQPQP